MINAVEAKVPQTELRTLAEFRYQLRRFLSFSEIVTEQRGIAAQQYQLIQAIAAAPEGHQASISYLAERMVLRHNSTVELVDRAERAGLVRREPDENDLRRSLVRLTMQGERMLHDLAVEHLNDLAPRCDHLIRSLQELQRTLKGGGGAPAEG